MNTGRLAAYIVTAWIGGVSAALAAVAAWLEQWPTAVVIGAATIALFLTLLAVIGHDIRTRTIRLTRSR